MRQVPKTFDEFAAAIKEEAIFFISPDKFLDLFKKFLQDNDFLDKWEKLLVLNYKDCVKPEQDFSAAVFCTEQRELFSCFIDYSDADEVDCSEEKLSLLNTKWQLILDQEDWHESIR